MNKQCALTTSGWLADAGSLSFRAASATHWTYGAFQFTIIKALDPKRIHSRLEFRNLQNKCAHSHLFYASFVFWALNGSGVPRCFKIPRGLDFTKHQNKSNAAILGISRYHDRPLQFCPNQFQISWLAAGFLLVGWLSTGWLNNQSWIVPQITNNNRASNKLSQSSHK